MTAIEWTDETWNPVSGCTKVSPGCKNCYAKRLWPRIAGAEAKRLGGPPRQFEEVQMHSDRLDAPLRWKSPRRIFVNSMSDLFHEDVSDDFLLAVFTTMAKAPQHTFQILTKRADRMNSILSWWHAAGLTLREGCGAVLPNVWLGVSVENQGAANERIPLLLQTPAAVRFLSCEPLLEQVVVFSIDGPVDVVEGAKSPIDWVIAGGESGPRARRAEPRWYRSLRDQCESVGTAFFMKQITERGRKIPFEDFPADLQVREFPR